jgi:hypothetical protein
MIKMHKTYFDYNIVLLNKKRGTMQDQTSGKVTNAHHNHEGSKELIMPFL